MNHLTKHDADAHARRLAELLKRLTPWFAKWHETFPTHEVTTGQIKTYCEVLVDRLAPEHVDLACKWATQNSESFPKPVHILRGLTATVGEDSVQHNRPAYLDEPPNSENAEFMELMRSIGAEPPHPNYTRHEPPKKKEFTFAPTRSLEEQKADLRRRGWLK